MEKLLSQNLFYHRQYQYAVKMQSRIDRSIEGYIRDVFGYSPMLPEADRKLIEKKTNAFMKQCRKGTAPAEYADLVEMVLKSDNSRKVWDEVRAKRRLAQEKIAKQFPGWTFVESVAGIAAHGFSQIIAEATGQNTTRGLSDYPKFCKLWKRLCLAPYKGHAMPTWLRESWRPYKLKEEWTDPNLNLFFKPSRYALMTVLAQALRNHQTKGRKKVCEELGIDPDSEEGKKIKGLPTGRYGEVYHARLIKTELNRPDWNNAHRERHALMIMFKRFIRDLWRAWRDDVKPNWPNRPRVPMQPNASGDAENSCVREDEISVGGPARAKTEKRRTNGVVAERPSDRLSTTSPPPAAQAAEGRRTSWRLAERPNGPVSAASTHAGAIAPTSKDFQPAADEAAVEGRRTRGQLAERPNVAVSAAPSFPPMPAPDHDHA